MGRQTVVESVILTAELIGVNFLHMTFSKSALYFKKLASVFDKNISVATLL